MDITTKSIEELKAIAYDVLVQRDTATRNLQIVENEIAKRAKEVTNEIAEEPKKEKHD